MFYSEIKAITEGLPRASFQARVYAWLLTCFGETVTFNKTERNHRFLEEALETVQAFGCTAEEAHELVDYVYGRPVGDKSQEVGGALLTLTALCIANGYNIEDLGEMELARVWGKIEIIRAKQAGKPKRGPLPEANTPSPPPEQTAGKNGDHEETKQYVLGPLEAALKKWRSTAKIWEPTDTELAKAITDYFGT